MIAPFALKNLYFHLFHIILQRPYISSNVARIFSNKIEPKKHPLTPSPEDPLTAPPIVSKNLSQAPHNSLQKKKTQKRNGQRHEGTHLSTQNDFSSGVCASFANGLIGPLQLRNASSLPAFVVKYRSKLQIVKYSDGWFLFSSTTAAAFLSFVLFVNVFLGNFA